MSGHLKGFHQGIAGHNVWYTYSIEFATVWTVVVFQTCSFFAYDNNVYGLQSYSPKMESFQVIVRGECNGLRDLETGRVYSEKLTLAAPSTRQDSATVIDEPVEYAFEVPVFGGQSMFFEII